MRRWMVKAETHRGSILTLRSGFASKEAAEGHKIVARMWRRVWVEAQGAAPQRERADEIDVAP